MNHLTKVSGHMSLYEDLQGAVTHQRGVLLQKASAAGLPQYVSVCVCVCCVSR